MKQIDLNEKIPPYDIFLFFINECKCIQKIFVWEHEKHIPNWKELLENVCKEHKPNVYNKSIRIIAEDSMSGKVYHYNNYPNELWEYGSTEGYA